MKRIHWLRRFFLLATMFAVGAASTGITPTWIKILLACSFGGYLLLMTEFEHDQKKPTSGATEVS